MKISKIKLMELITEEIEEALNPHKSLSAQAEEEYEEPEEIGGFGADTVFDLGPVSTAAGQKEPEPLTPPVEHLKTAKKIYIDFGIPASAQAIEILAWELYRAEENSPTKSMANPPKKKKRWRFFENQMRSSNPELLMLLRKILQTQQGPYEKEKELMNLSPDEQQQLVVMLHSLADTAREHPSPIEVAENIERYIREELEAYLEEEKENNPWAICPASVGREDKAKYEKCVKSVKAQNKGA